MVGLDHLVGELDGELGLLGVVLDDHLDVLVAGLLDGELEGVAHVDAEAGAATGGGGDHADLDRLGEGEAADPHRQAEHGGRNQFVHFDYSHSFL